MTESSFNIVKKIYSSNAAGVGLFAYKTDTPGVVTIMGSFFGGDTYAPAGKSLLPDIVVGLLDTGTKKHSKEQLRSRLESLGAAVSLAARGNRVIFTIQAMPEDIDAVISILVEEIHEPIFPERELGILKHQFASSLHEERSETTQVAMGDFLRAIYPAGHANYQESIVDREKALKAINRADVVSFHKQHFGRNGLYVSIVGDIDPKKVERVVQKHVQNLPEKKSSIPTRPRIMRSATKRLFTTIKDKMAVDVVLGHELPITRKDPQYYPLVILIELLGASGFTSHLFQTVRERDGLTYVIRAGLAGFGDSDQGHWFVRSMFAPHLFTKGLDTILKEIAIFLDTGLTDIAIEKKKEELVGAFAVSLGTTGGIARSILWTKEEGFPLSFIDEYPNILRSITPDQVRKVAHLIEPKRLTIAAAGSIDKSGKPL